MLNVAFRGKARDCLRSTATGAGSSVTTGEIEYPGHRQPVIICYCQLACRAMRNGIRAEKKSAAGLKMRTRPYSQRQWSQQLVRTIHRDICARHAIGNDATLALNSVRFLPCCMPFSVICEFGTATPAARYTRRMSWARRCSRCSR